MDLLGAVAWIGGRGTGERQSGQDARQRGMSKHARLPPERSPAEVVLARTQPTILENRLGVKRGSNVEFAVAPNYLPPDKRPGMRTAAPGGGRGRSAFRVVSGRVVPDLVDGVRRPGWRACRGCRRGSPRPSGRQLPFALSSTHAPQRLNGAGKAKAAAQSHGWRGDARTVKVASDPEKGVMRAAGL